MMQRLSLRDIPAGHFCTYGHTDYRNGVPWEPHDHDFFEFFWVESGEGFHWINGHRLPLVEGTLTLIHASDAHCFTANADDGFLRIVNLAFPSVVWKSHRRRYFANAPIFFSAPEVLSRTYHLDASQMALIRHAATHLRSGRRERLQVEAFLLFVLALLQTDLFSSSVGSAPDWIRKVCAEISIQRNFAQGMPGLVKLAGRSPEHVAREFRRYLGRTPTEVINHARLAFAAERLATTEETILSIALECGLENLSYFYRLFQGKYGITPRDYRMQQRRTGRHVISNRPKKLTR